MSHQPQQYTWNPTEKQFRSYLEKETEHCHMNLQKARPKDTLHSDQTVERTKRMVKVGADLSALADFVRRAI